MLTHTCTCIECLKLTHTCMFFFLHRMMVQSPSWCYEVLRVFIIGELYISGNSDYLSSSTNCLSFGLFLLDCISYNTATRLRLDTCTCISLLSHSYNFAGVLSIVHCKVSWTLLPLIVHFYVCECVLSTPMYPHLLCILPFSDFTLLSMYYRLPSSVICHSTFEMLCRCS